MSSYSSSVSANSSKRMDIMQVQDTSADLCVTVAHLSPVSGLGLVTLSHFGVTMETS